VLSTLRYFEEEYKAYIEGGPSYARKMSGRTQAGETPKETVKVAATP
jgi:NADH-quinone oxidoreductase subunit F/NADP-reducing hydrogenase subunit HndC